MQLNTIKSEGSLIPSDLLETIYTGDAPGQKAVDFGIHGKVRLIDEIASCWSDAKAYWEAFQHGINRVKDGESGATVTREQWILPLLRTLGFDGISFSRSAIDVGGRSYAISHRLGDEQYPLPIHIEGARFELDKRPPTGVPRISPHALVQEYLNRTDALWGIVTNGKQLRILRDSVRLSRPSYLEFNLREMMEGEHFTDFQLFYRIVHRTRFPRETEKAHDCLLEEYYQSGIESGGRVRERLRDGVEEALRIFGNGFLEHPRNSYLLELIRNGKLSPTDYYRQLLRLIYRFLFLMVSEERKLVGPDPKNDKLYKLYTQNFSVNRLRDKVEHALAPKERYWDLWEGVKQTFMLYSDKSAGDLMGVDVLNGDLFGTTAIPELEKASLYNRDFLHAFAHLSLFKEDKSIRRINYGYLDVEELGSVYESLLDYHPVFSNKEDKPKFELVFGTERKSTGSYYTRPELVQELIKSALAPVIEDRLESAQTKKDKEKAILSIKVCDPASGSGHFLLAAARRIGNELAKVRSGEEQPTPTEFKQAVRDVIQHCIYGVDINPLAVDLCKVALWLEGHNRGYPLTFLDHRMKCGNSLVGVDTLDRLLEGIPSEAFNPVTGDDKEVSKKIKARNRLELKTWESGQLPLIKNIDEEFKKDLRSFAYEVQRVDSIVERGADDVGKKQQEYERLRGGSKWLKDWTAANIWTSAFFYPLTDEDEPALPTQDKLISYLAQPDSAHAELVSKANTLSRMHRFFHWSLELPDVFEAGGFDVVLGNPPWDVLQANEQEYFESHSKIIAELSGAKRKQIIKDLERLNPELFTEWKDYNSNIEMQGIFFKESGRNPYLHGKINYYPLFAELGRSLINSNGYMGMVLPTSVATDDSNKFLFADIVENKKLKSIYDFENREKLFADVDSRYKFSLVTISGKQVESSRFAFFLTNTDQIDEEMRNFTLSSNDIELINPNTRTVPIFRTKFDANLTKIIYNKFSVLINELTGENPWRISFKQGLFNMTSDSHLFRTKEELVNEGALLQGNRFIKDNQTWLPLYEAKMMWQYDHRFGSYQDVDSRTSTQLPTPTEIQYQNPCYVVQPWYWVINQEITLKLEKWEKKWLFGVRDIARATDERTGIFSLVPNVGVGARITLLILSNDVSVLKFSCLIGCVNSLIFDYIVRQKVGGINIAFFIIKQLPIPSQDIFDELELTQIVPRTLELAYTAWDMKSYADDVWRDSDNKLRQAIQMQWEENKLSTGEHDWNPPEWTEIADGGIPLTPFKWDEGRRALLRAELDAYYAKLYGLNRDELRYILDPQDVYGTDFPGETFRVLKEKEIRQYGEYRTRRLVLEAWDRLFGDEA